MAGKEAILVLLDVGSSMFEQFPGSEKSKLEIGMESLQHLLQTKILFSQSHEVGLMLFGAEEAEDNNTFYIREIKKPDFEFIRNVMELNQHDPPANIVGGDIFDAMGSALDTLDAYVGKKKYSKKIYILTNGQGKTKYSANQIENLCNNITNYDVKVNVIAIDFCNTIENDDDDEQADDPNQTDIQNDNQKKLFKISNLCQNNVLIVTARQAISIYKQFRSKSIYPRVKLRTGLEITSKLKVEICVYTKTSIVRLPSLKKYSLNANFEKDEVKGKIQQEKKFTLNDDPDNNPIDQEFHMRAFYYGKKLVPINKILLDEMKFQEEKCLKILCFLKRSKLPRQYYMGGVDMVVPPKENIKDQQAFNALVVAMLELDKVAFVRYISRKNSAPKLGALIPYQNLKYKCLWLVTLPTSEDLRDFQFQSLKECTATQEKAVGDLIDAMDLENMEDEEGNKYEQLKPTETFNPVLQHFYQVIVDRAISDQNSELKPLDPVINEIVHPEKKNYAKFAEVINNCKAKFDLKVKELKVSQKNKMFWKDALEKKKQAALHLQNAAAVEGDLKIEESKNVEENEMEINFSKKFNFDQEEKIEKISEDSPIEDFQKMITEKNKDLTQQAITQMKELICQIVQKSILGSYYIKALQCLQELRAGCITEDEAITFNDYMYDLKDLFSTGKQCEFWKMVMKEGITLIMNTESTDSAITPQEANQFLIENTSVVQQAQPQQQPLNVVDDIMDEIE